MNTMYDENGRLDLNYSLDLLQKIKEYKKNLILKSLEIKNRDPDLDNSNRSGVRDSIAETYAPTVTTAETLDSTKKVLQDLSPETVLDSNQKTIDMMTKFQTTLINSITREISYQKVERIHSVLHTPWFESLDSDRQTAYAEKAQKSMEEILDKFSSNQPMTQI